MAIRFIIRGESIQLDQLLKATGLCQSGGAAKSEVAEGLVKVDGTVETRKRAALRPGQVVEYGGETVELAVLAPGEAPPAREHRVKAAKKKAKPFPPGVRPPPPAEGAKRPGSPSRPGARPSGARSGAPVAGTWPKQSGPPKGREADRGAGASAGPRARPSGPRAGPSARPSAPRAGPSDRPSAPRSGPSDRPSAPRTGPSARPSAPRAGPSDRPSGPRKGPFPKKR